MFQGGRAGAAVVLRGGRPAAERAVVQERHGPGGGLAREDRAGRRRPLHAALRARHAPRRRLLQGRRQEQEWTDCGQVCSFLVEFQQLILRGHLILNIRLDCLRHDFLTLAQRRGKTL